ncbi:MAG TPA: contractile injection system protein, VgrG/Pvc8 family [Anaeromyxobacter sp.]|nr:contractile injection system protein, VgrG/Pvc8 family [Anaeromyxobacter sp.]
MKALTGLPALSLELGGAPLDAPAARALASVRVRQALSVPSVCELTWVDPPDEVGDVGARLVVRVADREPALFQGEVTAIELAYGASRQREVRLRAYDALHRLRKRQPVRAHVQVTVADLARELCADLGVSVACAEDGPLWPWFVQWRESDLDLLAGLAERSGLYLALRGDTLHLLTLEGEGGALPLAAGDDLLECAVEVNADPACRRVAAAGWDLHAVEAHSGRAERARVGRSVDAEAPPSAVGAGGERVLPDVIAPTPAHADAAAQAELDRRIAREVVLRGVAEGDPALRPGARVELRGVAPRLAGTYVVTEATHVLDARRGFLTELSTEPPPARPASASAGMTVATVSRVDAGTGRVKVALTSFGDVETDWMQVLSPGAGADKGLAVLPDTGDLVVVLFARGEPAQGIVLGGLYGAKGPYDAGVEGGAVRRFTLRTPGGHVLRLDDDRRALRIEDARGSFVEMSPDEVRLRSRVPLFLEAPGQPVVIRGDRVDFRRG